MTARLRSRTAPTIACPIAGCPTRCVLADSVGAPGLGIWVCPLEGHGEFGPGVNEWDGTRLTPDPVRVPSTPRPPFIPVTSRECVGRHGYQASCCPICNPVPVPCLCGHDLVDHDPDEGLCGACGCPAWRVTG